MFFLYKINFQKLNFKKCKLEKFIDLNKPCFTYYLLLRTILFITLQQKCVRIIILILYGIILHQQI